MIHALKPLKPEPAKDKLTTAQDNPAVASCSKIWDRAYASMRKRKFEEDDAVAEADKAYCKAMPPLVGYENICDFIACVGYGMLIKVFVQGQGTRLLYAAQVALNAGATRTKKPKKQPQTGPNPPDSNPLAA